MPLHVLLHSRAFTWPSRNRCASSYCPPAGPSRQRPTGSCRCPKHSRRGQTGRREARTAASWPRLGTRMEVDGRRPVGPDHGDADNKEKIRQICPAAVVLGFIAYLTHCTLVRRFGTTLRGNPCEHTVRLAWRRRCL